MRSARLEQRLIAGDVVDLSLKDKTELDLRGLGELGSETVHGEVGLEGVWSGIGGGVGVGPSEVGHSGRSSSPGSLRSR